MVTALRKIVDFKQVLNVYYAFAYSHMQYAIVFWASCDKVRDEVFTAQKRLIRAMAGIRYWRSQTPLESARPWFEKFNLLPLFSLYLMECCKFVRRHPHYFQQVKEIHNYNTRSRNLYYVPAQVSSAAERNPEVYMLNLYNRIPVAIRNLEQ